MRRWRGYEEEGGVRRKGDGVFTTADHRRPDSALRGNKASLFHLHVLAEKAGVKLERAVQCKYSRGVCTSNTKLSLILFFIKIRSNQGGKYQTIYKRLESHVNSFSMLLLHVCTFR